MDSRSISFVIAAYLLTWVVLGAYALFVHRTVRRARVEYERIVPRATGVSP